MLRSYQLQKFQNELQSLEEAIVVEGINDKKQLSLLGAKNIFTISGSSLVSFVERISNLMFQSVVILTDFDNEGERKAKHLYELFHSQGIRTNSPFRHRFKSLFKISKVEEISYVTKDLQEGNYEKNFKRRKFLERNRNSG